MSGPRVYDGTKWVSQTEEAYQGVTPPPQEHGGDGKIFVAIPSFRDGKRCAETLKSLFDNAADPDNIIVGLIEQNAPEDRFCLEEFCAAQGIEKHYRRQMIRKDVTKVIAEPERLKCNRFNQIRLLAFHNKSAKGPSYARSMTRKILGNEEFCMQIDAHSSFAKNWDQAAKEEWKNTQNEFGVISNVPAPQGEQAEYESGKRAGEVPRQCKTSFQDNGIPNYMAPGDGMAADLQKPLLANTWSSAFSFAKCHLEESAPYDPFTPYVMGAEQFPRFVKMWTRGYDVYTPTRNIVFTNYQPQPEGHDMKEWFQARRNMQRARSLNRIKTFIEVKDGDRSDAAKANLGIYGIGKRRSLAQLQAFVGIDLAGGIGNGQTLPCANLKYVPYDANVSPTDNLYDSPNDLDSQPEYPLRTELKYYKQVEQIIEPPVNLDLPMVGKSAVTPVEASPFPAASTMFSLWFMGLALWCVYFMNSGSRKSRRKKASGFKNV